MKIRTYDCILMAMLTAVLVICQVTLAFLPNIEVVSLLVILYTLFFRKRVFYIIYGFAILEGLIYGFGLWWVMYLYIWTILALVTFCFIKQESAVLFAVVSGAFGLAFGFLCSFPYFVTGGVAAGFSFWIAGIPADILHGVGNFFVTLVLFKPLYRMFKRLGTE